MRRFVVVLMLALVILTAGCVHTEYVYVNCNSGVNLRIKWDEFAAINSAGLGSLVEGDEDVTMVGARLVYEDESAVFMQSVERKVAEEEGVITIQVPPTKKAHLYVAGINDTRAETIWLGIKKNITILENTMIDIPMEDIEWVRAEWELVGFFDADTNERVEPNITRGERQSMITFPKELKRVELIARVRDPFQPGPPPGTWGELLINLTGSGSVGDNIQGWREMSSRFDNPQPGEVNESKHLGFQPALSSEMFYLTAPNGHSIPPIGLNRLIVRWE